MKAIIVVMAVALAFACTPIFAQNPATSQSQSDTTHYDQYGKKKIDPASKNNETQYRSDPQQRKKSAQETKSSTAAPADTVESSHGNRKIKSKTKRNSKGNSNGPPTGARQREERIVYLLI